MKRRVSVLFLAVFCIVEVFGAHHFSAAKPVWPVGEEATMNSFFVFRASFKGGVSSVLRITAGYDYKAWLNGEFVSFGPARCAPGRFRVDEWPLKVKDGENRLEITVAGYNCNNFYLPVQTPFLQAEVLVDGRVVARTGAKGEITAYRTGRLRKVPRFSYQRTFCEVYRLPVEEGSALVLGEQAPKTLLPREWAKPDFHIVDDFRPLSLERVRRDTTVKLQQSNFIVSTQENYRYYPVAELEENPYYDIQQLKTVSRDKAPAARNGWYALADSEGLVFSTACEEAGFPRLSVRCSGPTTVYFTFDELLQDDGSVDPLRTGSIGTLVWHLGAGTYALEGFEPIAFKCARILVIGGNAEVSAPSVRTYVSPQAARASFRSSDPALEKIFNAARKSYEANAVDCLTDCPIRERAGWLGDTFFTGRASKWLTGSTENERLFFENFLMAERFDFKEVYCGLVPAVWPVDLMCDACFIPNWNHWLVLELEEFQARGGDPSVIKRFEPLVKGAVAWFERYCNSDGLLEKLPGWVFLEWSRANGLVQDVNYPSNMMYAKMLDAVDRLYGRPDLKAKAARIREMVRRQSLTADGWYCDNAVRQIDGSLKLSGERTEVCQYYAFFTGVADKRRDALLWKRLVEDFGPMRLKNAKWKEPGLWARLHTPMVEGKWKEIWPANFIFGTCLRLELLSLDGRSAQVYDEVREYFLQMAEQTGTLWEHCDPRASCCHGFASIAVEYLFRDVLGFKGVDAAGRAIVERPAGLNLDWCEAVIPTSATDAVRVNVH